MAHLLIRYGADVTLKSKEGWTALHLASYYGDHNNDSCFLMYQNIYKLIIPLKVKIKLFFS